MFLNWFWVKIFRLKADWHSLSIHQELLGEWQSLNGYYLIIRADKQAVFQKIDYLSSYSQSLKWGKLIFTNNTLIIKYLYSQNYLHIDRYPFLQQGKICMILNGMIFTKII